MKLIKDVSQSDAFHLRKIDWEYFITLTWGKIPPKYARKRILYEYIRRLGKKFKCKNSKHKKFKHTYLWDLTWAVCFELGSITSRPHMHMLMKLNDCSTNRISQQSILKRTWEKDVGKGKGVVGLADVCPYDPTRNGAGYIVKNSTWKEDSKYGYELVKFTPNSSSQDQEVSLITSPSVILFLFEQETRKRRERKGGGHRGRLLKDLRQSRLPNAGKVSVWQPERFRHPADKAGRLYV